MTSVNRKALAKAWMRPRQLLIAVVLLTTLYLFWCELNYNLTFSSWNIAAQTTLQNEAADHHLPAEKVKSKNAPTYIKIPIRPNQPASRPKRVTEAIPEFSSASTTAELSNSTERATTDAVTICNNTAVAYLTKHPAKEVEADSWTSMRTTSRRVNTTSKSATSRRRANDSIYKKLFTAQKATLLKRFAAAYPQENPRKVRRILEVAYFRSGSSFLGQLLSANPQTFYHFEPLRTLSQGSRLYGEAALRGLGYVTDFFSCDFANHSDHLRLAMKFSHPFRQNSYLWSVCEGVKPVCVDPEFLKAVCKTAPTQVMKVVRIGMDTVRRFLLDRTNATAEELSVVHLVRDPRAIWMSRQRRKWCSSTVDCSSAAVLCDEIERDLDVFENISREFPGRAIQVRYEDLALDPLNVTLKMYKSLGLPFTASVRQFIESHTNEKDVAANRQPYGTSKHSRDVAHSWKRKIKPESALLINRVCSRVIKRLGYEP